MVGLLAALLEVCLPGLSGWCPFRVPQILWLTSLPRGGRDFWFWHSGTGVAPGNVPYSHHGFTPGAGSVLSVSAFSRWFSVLKVLVLKCQVLPFSWALTLLAYCLGLRGTCPVVTLPGVPLWFFRTGWDSVELRRACFLSDCTLKSWPWLRLGVLGIPCLGFSVALLPGAGAVSFAFVMVVTLCSGTSLAPRLAGFTVPARPTRAKSHGRRL